MKFNVQDLWEAGKFPVFNGILFSNGNVDIYDLKKFAIENSSSIILKPENIIASYEFPIQKEKLNVSISECFELIDYRKRLKFGCGETSCDGEGFLAISNIDTNDMQWIVILPYFGSFEECYLDHNQVVVKSSENFLIMLDICNPSYISITRLHSE